MTSKKRGNTIDWLTQTREFISRNLARLFPEIDIFQRKLSIATQIIIFFVFFLVFYLAGHLLPLDSVFGFDWVNVFSIKILPHFYTPWSIHVVSLLNWPALIGITLAATALASLKRARHPLSIAFVFLSLPLVWTVFLGQLEGLVVLGLLGLPWLTPLALLKPQISFFAFGAKKSYILAAIIWLIISLIIWGFWPKVMFDINAYHPEGRYVNDIAIGWIGALLAIPLFWFSRGDMDMLMLAGAFMTPHLIPYNLLVVSPAIARLSPIAAGLAFLLSWLPFSANWIGDNGWWLGWVFVAFLWFMLAYQRYEEPIKRWIASRRLKPPSPET